MSFATLPRHVRHALGSASLLILVPHLFSAEPPPPKALDTTVTLEEFRVEEQAESGYKPGSTFTATKTNTSLFDTPQSISVITEQLINEQQAGSYGEVLKNVASITKMDKSFGAYEQFNSRGFILGNANGHLRNGRTYSQLHATPMESVERVEVLKGPASVLYGQGAPGGAVNIITKRPTAKPTYSGKVTLGSYGLKQADLDFGGPLGKGEKLGYRALLTYEDSDSYRDFMFVEREYAAAAVSWAAFKTTKILFNADWLEDDRPMDQGTFALGTGIYPGPISRVYTLPWGRYTANVWNAGFNSQTTLGDAWNLYAGYNFQYYHRIRVDNLLGAPNLTTGAITNSSRIRNQRQFLNTYNVDLTGRVEFGPTRHTLLAGANYNLSHTYEFSTNTLTFTQNLFNPVYTATRPLYTFVAKPVYANSETTGFYAQDQISFGDQFDVVVGARYDKYESYSYNELTGGTASSVPVTNNTNTSPRVGFVYRPIPIVSLYASYAESFEANGFATQGTNANTQLDPTTGFQYEAGVKADLLDRKLGVTAAVFDMTRESAPYFDSVANLTVQLGEQRHRGFEVEAFGQITPHWSVMGSYMWLDAEVVRDQNVALVGRVPAGVPETTLTGWTTYHFNREALKGLSLSAGAQYVGDRPGDATGTFNLGSYTRWDAGGSYALPLAKGQVLLRVNVNNVFDKLYYYGRFGRNNVNFGDPRFLKVSVTYSY